MKLHISLIALSGAVMLFAVPVQAAPQAAQANVVSEGWTSLYLPTAAKKLKTRTTLPLGFKAPGGASRWIDNCQVDNQGITHCDECDVDWDQTPPQKICITNAVCYDGAKIIDCPS
jgi:hypothetical protein